MSINLSALLYAVCGTTIAKDDYYDSTRKTGIPDSSGAATGNENKRGDVGRSTVMPPHPVSQYRARKLVK
jgi:hypothetical protein